MTDHISTTELNELVNAWSLLLEEYGITLLQVSSNHIFIFFFVILEIELRASSTLGKWLWGPESCIPALLTTFHQPFDP